MRAKKVAKAQIIVDFPSPVLICSIKPLPSSFPINKRTSINWIVLNLYPLLFLLFFFVKISLAIEITAKIFAITSILFSLFLYESNNVGNN